MQILFRDSTACYYVSAGTAEASWSGVAYLVSHHRLLNSGEVFQWRQKHMTPLRPTNIFDEVAKLLTQGDKDLVLVLNGLCHAVRVMCRHIKWGRGRRPSRKGINSSRVRSAPRARAMVERRRMAFRRRITSSCYILVNHKRRGSQRTAKECVAVSRTLSSSMRTAMG